MWRRFLARPLAALTLLVFPFTPASGQDDDAKHSPLGFLPASRAGQLRAEALATAIPTPENARALLRTLTEEPHVAGSKADHESALLVRDKLREWGWKADIAEYHVLLNYPVRSPHSPFLELTQPHARRLSLQETPNTNDKDSASPSAYPAFHGYGVSGDVTGQVVYANYGRPDDFTTLERLGIDVRDKIVLVRYGELFRGLKIRNAQKRGARGVLIYSDPSDDGYAKGDVYPTGPYRPGSALQRGSVQFLSLGPGDPSTPDGPSTKDARRLPWHPTHGFAIQQDSAPTVDEWEKATGLKRADYFATIPSLPISYDAARPILEALGGPNAPTGWQGALPLAYHVGPGPAEVHFAIGMEYKVRPIWNVVATIPGTVEPDHWVMIGNHRDAWVYGAVDPSSGTTATLEACRALGAAVKNGWKPRRTLVYASWDAEEYGLVGSTEWADDHAKEIDAKAMMLLNVDSAVGGTEIDLDGVPSLRDLLLDACGAVTDIRSGRSLRQLWTEKRRSQWAANAALEQRDPLWDADFPDSHTSNRFIPQLNPLGSGSDYTAFLDHLGVPSLDVGFTGRYGVYHSVFDNFYWMEKFCDPEFITHTMAARLYTIIAMRAAGAEVFPARFTPYGEAMRDYVDDLRRMVERRNRALAPSQSRFTFAFEGLPGLVNSVRAFQGQASALDQATDKLTSIDAVEPARLARVNDALQRIERAFLLTDGLPSRPWFKHAIYAPGLTTGYACWPLPGVRQAVIDADAALLAAQLARLISRIDAATEALKTATDLSRAAADSPREARRSASEPRTGGS